jgi:hypothetical protein
MIRITIIAITILIVGLFAFAGIDHYTSAMASDSVTPHDADVDWSGNVDLRDPLASLSQFGAQTVGGRPVTETNVDANGNIKVAQQGVVDVNVVSENGPTPTVIPVATNMVVPNTPNIFQYSPYADITMCRTATAYFELTVDSPPQGSGTVSIVMRTSIDGLNPYPGIDSTVGAQFDSGSSSTTVRTSLALLWSGANAAPRTPYVTAQFSNWDTSLANRTVTASIWIYCTS